MSTSEVVSTIDPEVFGVKSDFAVTGGVKKILTRVPVRKPRKQDFVRVRPGDDWQRTVVVWSSEDERETVYVVPPQYQDEMASDAKQVHLFTSITKTGDVFLWPVAAAVDGRTNAWNESALDAIELAKNGWVRVRANMREGSYDIVEPTSEFLEPDWPKKSFAELLELAFKNRVIDSDDHHVLQSLRGAA